MEKVLGDAGTKLSVFVSDALGVSGRTMLGGVVDRRRARPAGTGRDRPGPDAHQHSPVLVDALTGRLDDYHAFLSATMLAHIDTLAARINTVTAHIESQFRPFQAIVGRLAVPGITSGAPRRFSPRSAPT